MILCHSDNLSQILHSETRSAAKGQQVGRIVVATLESLRTEEAYHLFWMKVRAVVDSVNVDGPWLPHRCKTPKRYDDVLSDSHFHDTSKVHYR